MGDRKFEDEGGAGVQHLQRGPVCAVKEYMLEESEEGVTVLREGTQQGGSSRSESCQEF